MKKLDIKSIFLGLFIGAIGITSIFAATDIKSATLSDVKVTIDSYLVQLDNPLVSIERYNEKDAKLYISVREIFEYIGYCVEFDSKANTLKLISPKDNINIPEIPSLLNNDIIFEPNNAPEHLGGTVKAVKESNIYIYEGVIGEDDYQIGDSFSANKGEQLNFKLNYLEYVSGDIMEENEVALMVNLSLSDNHNWHEFGILPKSLNDNPISASFPVDETANYNITILNYSEKEIKYSFILTIE